MSGSQKCTIIIACLIKAEVPVAGVRRGAAVMCRRVFFSSLYPIMRYV